MLPVKVKCTQLCTMQKVWGKPLDDDSHVKKDSVSYTVTKLSKNKNEKRNRKGDRKR